GRGPCPRRRAGAPSAGPPGRGPPAPRPTPGRSGRSGSPTPYRPPSTPAELSCRSLQVRALDQVAVDGVIGGTDEAVGAEGLAQQLAGVLRRPGDGGGHRLVLHAVARVLLVREDPDGVLLEELGGLTEELLQALVPGVLQGDVDNPDGEGPGL